MRTQFGYLLKAEQLNCSDADLSPLIDKSSLQALFALHSSGATASAATAGDKLSNGNGAAADAKSQRTSSHGVTGAQLLRGNLSLGFFLQVSMLLAIRLFVIVVLFYALL